VGSVEADDERQIAVADDWQLQRLEHSSSTNTAAPCPGYIGGPSEQAYTRPAPGCPASAAQYAVDLTDVTVDVINKDALMRGGMCGKLHGGWSQLFVALHQSSVR